MAPCSLWDSPRKCRLRTLATPTSAEHVKQNHEPFFYYSVMFILSDGDHHHINGRCGRIICYLNDEGARDVRQVEGLFKSFSQ
jgi:hypothetical protein